MLASPVSNLVSTTFSGLKATRRASLATQSNKRKSYEPNHSTVVPALLTLTGNMSQRFMHHSKHGSEVVAIKVTDANAFQCVWFASHNQEGLDVRPVS